MALQQVAILGLGVIGASLGLALRRGNSALQVVGFDISTAALQRAVRAGAIERSCGTLPEACAHADAIVLAAPVRGILLLLPEIAPLVQEGTLVTDTGGTKGEIVRVAESAIPPHSAFVGGHPLTGPLTARVSEPSATLYDGAVYCLTPSSNVPDWAMDKAVELVQTSGAQPHWLDAAEHDGLLAAVSHLPYFTSVALVSTLAAQSSWQEMSGMAAGGFRSVSALTEGDPQVWTDVAATNGENVVRQLDRLIERLGQMRQQIASGDARLQNDLSAAQAAHRAWLADRGEGASPAATPGAPAIPAPASWLDRFRRT